MQSHRTRQRFSQRFGLVQDIDVRRHHFRPLAAESSGCVTMFHLEARLAEHGRYLRDGVPDGLLSART